MPVPRSLKRLALRALLPREDYVRVMRATFGDAGHGYDPLGLSAEDFAFAMALAFPFYAHYFRVRSYGAEHIPKRGPAIVAANHSGMLPLDGVMLAVDIARKTRPTRIPRTVGDVFIPFMPWVGTAFSRAGVVSGSRGNFRHLLESGELLLVFPEGTPGISKGFQKRYQLQEFRVGHAELALRHRAPVVPTAVIGAEESWAQIGRVEGLGAFGAPFLPVPLTPLPLPARFHLHYGEPIALHEIFDPEDSEDPSVVVKAARIVQTAVEKLVQRGLSERAGVFV